MSIALELLEKASKLSASNEVSIFGRTSALIKGLQTLVSFVQEAEKLKSSRDAAIKTFMKKYKLESEATEFSGVSIDDVFVDRPDTVTVSITIVASGFEDHPGMEKEETYDVSLVLSKGSLSVEKTG